MPGSHLSHSSALSAPLNVPGLHGVSAAEPSAQKLPAVQLAHADAPADGAKLPSAHGVHVDVAVVDVAEAYLPASQADDVQLACPATSV